MDFKIPTDVNEGILNLKALQKDASLENPFDIDIEIQLKTHQHEATMANSNPCFSKVSCPMVSCVCSYPCSRSNC